MSSEKLSRIYKGISDLCRKCKKLEGPFYHFCWICNKTTKLCIDIHTVIQTNFKVYMQLRQCFSFGTDGHSLKKESKFVSEHVNCIFVHV